MKQVSLLDNVACSSTYICIYNTIYCITSTIYQGFCRICTEFTIWTTMTSNSEYNKTSKRYLMFIWRVLDHTAVYTFACFLRWIWCHKGTYGLVLKMLHMNLKQIAVLGLHRMRWRFCFFFGGEGETGFFWICLFLWKSAWENHAKKWLVFDQCVLYLIFFCCCCCQILHIPFRRSWDPDHKRQMDISLPCCFAKGILSRLIQKDSKELPLEAVY